MRFHFQPSAACFTKQAAGVRIHAALMFQQPLFALQTAAVTREAAVRTDYAVAGDNDRYAVVPYGICCSAAQTAA